MRCSRQRILQVRTPLLLLCAKQPVFLCFMKTCVSLLHENLCFFAPPKNLCLSKQRNTGLLDNRETHDFRKQRNTGFQKAEKHMILGSRETQDFRKQGNKGASYACKFDPYVRQRSAMLTATTFCCKRRAWVRRRTYTNFGRSQQSDNTPCNEPSTKMWR